MPASSVDLLDLNAETLVQAFAQPWDEGQAKGIDDYLVAEIRDDPQRGPTDIIRMLLADAQPFIGSFSKGKVDLDAVEAELKKVHLSTLYRDQICKDLHEPLGVRVDLLRAVGQGQELEARTNHGFAEVERRLSAAMLS